MLLADSGARPWSVVTGVHGAPGVSGWKQLVPGMTLRGAWEAVELARIPARGLSGLHRHSRTNELYLGIAGTGEYLLDGGAVPLRPGELAMAAVGSVHGLRNAGDDDVVWLVVEVPATTGGMPVNLSKGPIDLDHAGPVDLAEHGLDPLRQAGVDRLAAGESRELDTGGGELFGYLVSGAGVVAAGRAVFPVPAGTGITLTLGERAILTASEPCQLFWVRSGLPGEPR